MEKKQTKVSFVIDAREFDEDKLNLSILSIINSGYIPELLDDIDIHIVTLPTKILDMGSTSFLYMLHSNTNIVFHRLADGEDIKEIALCTCSTAIIFLNLSTTYIYKPLLFKHKSEDIDKDIIDIASMLKKSNIAKDDWQFLFDNASTIISALKNSKKSINVSEGSCSTISIARDIPGTYTTAKNVPCTYADEK